MKILSAAILVLLFGCATAKGPTAGGPGATECSVGSQFGRCETRCVAGQYASCDGSVNPPKCECKSESR